MLRSSSWMPTPDVCAISFSALESPPRVGSRMQRMALSKHSTYRPPACAEARYHFGSRFRIPAPPAGPESQCRARQSIRSEELVSRTSLARRKLQPRPAPSPIPVVLMNNSSPLPFSTTLVSPVTTSTPASAAARCSDSTTRRSTSHRQALFKDEARAQEERLRPAHGQIIHRAMHSERADISSRKEQRLHHERVGGECQARVSDIARSPDRPAVPAQGSETQAGRCREPTPRSVLPPLPCPRTMVSFTGSGVGQLSSAIVFVAIICPQSAATCRR